AGARFLDVRKLALVRRELFGSRHHDRERLLEPRYANRLHGDVQRLLLDDEAFLPSRHRQVDLREELRVEERAVEGPGVIVDLVTLAKRVQAVALPRVCLARHLERVYDAAAA